ncbi:MAG TPA: serine/threonine-protein kinase [Ktedonobacteraceae bacterium]|jgi:serine/threonine-protein kinase
MAHPVLADYTDWEAFDSQLLGAMATIFLATRKSTGQRVVIKVMLPTSNEQQYRRARQRFDQEALISEMLKDTPSAHLLPAIDSGDFLTPTCAWPLPYLITPYIPHGSLTGLLRMEPLWQTWRLEQIVELVKQIALGLAALHRHKIVHRDLKPGNILWQPDTSAQMHRRVHVWLMDFGIAWKESSLPTSDILGTPMYMSPEQRMGQITRHSDQYALALLARLLLTGELPPLEQRDDGCWRVNIAASREPLTILKPAFPAAVNAVMRQALDPEPQSRFPDVLTFAQALAHALLPATWSELPPVMEPAPVALPIILLAPNPQPHPSPDGIHDEETEGPHVPLRSLMLEDVAAVRAAREQPERNLLDRRSTVYPSMKQPHLPSLPCRLQFQQEVLARPAQLLWSPDSQGLLCTFYQQPPLFIHVQSSASLPEEMANSPAACWSPDGRFLALSLYSPNDQRGVRFVSGISRRVVVMQCAYVLLRKALFWAWIGRFVGSLRFG